MPTDTDRLEEVMSEWNASRRAAKLRRPSVARYREPQTPAELAHVIRLMLTDAFGWGVAGRLEESGGELDVALPSGEEVTIFLATAAVAVQRGF